MPDSPPAAPEPAAGAAAVAPASPAPPPCPDAVLVVSTAIPTFPRYSVPQHAAAALPDRTRLATDRVPPGQALTKRLVHSGKKRAVTILRKCFGRNVQCALPTIRDQPRR